MLKRIFTVGIIVALTGCATHQQANTAVGAGVGAVIGNAVGGRGGAAVGAVLGTAIGSQQPTYSQPRVVEQQVIVQQPNYSGCSRFWNWEERRACERGAEFRARQEQNRRINEAYHYGYGR
jgi:hypothetical protein